MSDARKTMHQLGAQARAAAAEMRSVATGAKDRALRLVSTVLRRESAEIIAANDLDMKAAADVGLDAAMQDRLRLDSNRIEAMAAGVEQVASLPDPVGAIDNLVYRPSGIQVGRMRVPLGVIGMIYESRPNVTADAAALCLKSGNAVILRGGSEAIHSNRAIAACLRRALVDGGLPQDAVQLVDSTERALVGEMLKAKTHIDVIIPRGGRSLTERVAEESRIPVIKHLDGVCHVYIDGAADAEMAMRIAINAKTHRFGVCNAMETLLVHTEAAKRMLPAILKAMHDKGVEIRGCERTAALAGEVPVKPAKADDWVAEYLAPILAVRVVDSLEAAMAHIAEHGSGHTDCIVTSNYDHGLRFLNGVDAASVMWNASTRFADGFEYGLGAEIGISTDRLHVRGPVGLEGLTTEKWVVFGHGEIRE